MLHEAACDRQVGCIHLQEQATGLDKPIFNWPVAFNDVHHDYDTTSNECLAVALGRTVIAAII